MQEAVERMLAFGFQPYHLRQLAVYRVLYDLERLPRGFSIVAIGAAGAAELTREQLMELVRRLEGPGLDLVLAEERRIERLLREVRARLGV